MSHVGQAVDPPGFEVGLDVLRHVVALDETAATPFALMGFISTVNFAMPVEAARVGQGLAADLAPDRLLPIAPDRTSRLPPATGSGWPRRGQRGGSRHGRQHRHTSGSGRRRGCAGRGTSGSLGSLGSLGGCGHWRGRRARGRCGSRGCQGCLLLADPMRVGRGRSRSGSGWNCRGRGRRRILNLTHTGC